MTQKKQKKKSAASDGIQMEVDRGGRAAVLALIAAWHFLPLKDWLEAIEDRIDGMGVLGGVLFVLVYVVAALLFVPGSILTLGAGYLFGIAGGMAVVWTAATASGGPRVPHRPLCRPRPGREACAAQSEVRRDRCGDREERLEGGRAAPRSPRSSRSRSRTTSSA